MMILTKTTIVIAMVMAMMVVMMLVTMTLIMMLEMNTIVIWTLLEVMRL